MMSLFYHLSHPHSFQKMKKMKKRKNSMTSLRVADDKIDKAVNNRRNWNAIDDVVHYIIYCITKRKKGPRKQRTKETESGYEQWLLQKQKKTIVEMSIKKGQWVKEMIPRAAGDTSHENRWSYQGNTSDGRIGHQTAIFQKDKTRGNLKEITNRCP